MSKLVEAVKGLEQVKAPEWAPFVKTGAHKERPPMQEDWWDIRVASVLKKIQKFGPIGTNNLAKYYGGRKNRGVRPDIKRIGSRNIIRKSLQQLEAAGLIKNNDNGKAGRVLTKAGTDFLAKNKEN